MKTLIVTSYQAEQVKILRGKGRSLSEIGLILGIHNRTVRAVLAGTAIVTP